MVGGGRFSKEEMAGRAEKRRRSGVRRVARRGRRWIRGGAKMG